MLSCSCGGLMRGKSICLNCSVLISVRDEVCPDCGEETNILLELMEDDIPLIRKTMNRFYEKSQYCRAYQLCRDMISVYPDEKSRESLDRFRKACEEEKIKSRALDIMRNSIRDLQNDRISKAYHGLIAASRMMEMPPEGRAALKKSRDILKSRSRRKARICYLISILCLALAIIVFAFSIMGSAAPGLYAAGSLAGLFILFLLIGLIISLLSGKL